MRPSKSTFSVLVVASLAFVLVLASRGAAADDLNAQIQSEMHSMQTNVKGALDRARHKAADLQAQRDKAIAASKSLAQDELKGVDVMRNYAALISARYVDDQGEYQAGMQLGQNDQEFVNRIFGRYLHSTPLQGPTSVGEAKRTLASGMQQLQELAKVHSEPTELNNGTLEMISYQLKDSEKVLHRYADLAAKLGIETETAATSSGNGEREPASAK